MQELIILLLLRLSDVLIQGQILSQNKVVSFLTPKDPILCCGFVYVFITLFGFCFTMVGGISQLYIVLLLDRGFVRVLWVCIRGSVLVSFLALVLVLRMIPQDYTYQESVIWIVTLSCYMFEIQPTQGMVMVVGLGSRGWSPVLVGLEMPITIRPWFGSCQFWSIFRDELLKTYSRQIEEYFFLPTFEIYTQKLSGFLCTCHYGRNLCTAYRRNNCCCYSCGFHYLHDFQLTFLLSQRDNQHSM